MTTAPDFRRYLYVSEPLMRGNDVLFAQRTMGMTASERDGLFGPSTGRAVQQFQGRRGLAADGIVGPRTWQRLVVECPSGTTSAGAVGIGDPTEMVGTRLSDLTSWRARYTGSVRWRLSARGVEIAPTENAVPDGDPTAVRHALLRFGADVASAAAKTGVPAELLVALMLTEADGGVVDPAARREAPAYISDEATPDRVACGPMLVPLATARRAISLHEPERDPAIVTSTWLSEPANGVLAGAYLVRMAAAITCLDPPLVACAYNAGDIAYEGAAANRWKIRQYPLKTGQYADCFIGWFNSCFCVFEADGCPFEDDLTFWHRLIVDV